MLAFLLLIVAFVMGLTVDAVYGIRDELRQNEIRRTEEMKTLRMELRLLSNDSRDLQSVMISHGYAKPTDFSYPAGIDSPAQKGKQP